MQTTLPMELEDTIVALASVPGPAARGIIRISGPATSTVLRTLFRPQGFSDAVPGIFEGRLIPWGETRSIPSTLFFWPEGRGYTGGESAEVHTIGSPPLLEALLSVFTRADRPASRIRLARPGEFTLRAFLSGRLDLTQAEAVLGLIDATSFHSLRTALKQLAGDLLTPLRRVREGLLETLAQLEAGLDFAEEEIEFVSREDVRSSLCRALDVVDAMAARMDSRTLSSEKPVLVLTGPPNSGKSTLFNVLSGSERALVSSRPGTTRDYIEAEVRFGDCPCLLIDTAGIDETRLDDIDDEARRLSTAAVERADLILSCDSMERHRDDVFKEPEMQAVLRRNLRATRLSIRTKSDLHEHVPFFPDERIISAKTGFGLDLLRKEIAVHLSRTTFSGDVVPGTAIRCRGALETAASMLRETLKKLGGDATFYDDVLLTAEIRGVLDALGLVDGSVHTEDILDRIFERFCIGK